MIFSAADEYFERSLIIKSIVKKRLVIRPCHVEPFAVSSHWKIKLMTVAGRDGKQPISRRIVWKPAWYRATYRPLRQRTRCKITWAVLRVAHKRVPGTWYIAAGPLYSITAQNFAGSWAAKLCSVWYWYRTRSARLVNCAACAYAVVVEAAKRATGESNFPPSWKATAALQATAMRLCHHTPPAVSHCRNNECAQHLAAGNTVVVHCILVKTVTVLQDSFWKYLGGENCRLRLQRTPPKIEWRCSIFVSS